MENTSAPVSLLLCTSFFSLWTSSHVWYIVTTDKHNRLTIYPWVFHDIYISLGLKSIKMYNHLLQLANSFTNFEFSVLYSSLPLLSLAPACTNFLIVSIVLLLLCGVLWLESCNILPFQDGRFLLISS